MNNKTTLFLGVLFSAVFFAGNAYAAEIRGKLKGLSPATITVSCPNFKRSAKIKKKGAYSIKGLPARKSCSFVISQEKNKSVALPFTTKNSVVVYSGKLKVRKGTIVVLRK